MLLILSISYTDELSDLRGQVKLLEDKNTKYMQENIEIQEVRLYRRFMKYFHIRLAQNYCLLQT